MTLQTTVSNFLPRPPKRTKTALASPGKGLSQIFLTNQKGAKLQGPAPWVYTSSDTGSCPPTQDFKIESTGKRSSQCWGPLLGGWTCSPLFVSASPRLWRWLGKRTRPPVSPKLLLGCGGGVLSDSWISHQKLWSVHDVRKPWSVSLPLSNHPKLGELSIQAPHRWGDTQQEQPPPSFGRILLHQSRQVAPGLTCLWKLKLSHRKTLNNPLGLKRWLFQWDLSFFISLGALQLLGIILLSTVTRVSLECCVLSKALNSCL